jgi:hypothetical protein
MDLQQGFKSYLIRNKLSEGTIRTYLSAFTFINSIIDKNKIPKIENWNTSNSDEYFNQINQDSIFIAKNTKDKNKYSAALSNYIKYMKEETIIPKIPFDSFGWRWATTGITSHLNKPRSLRIVLDALLINGNGEDNYTENFKKIVDRLCINKYDISEKESEKLTKRRNSNVEKNIIENSANYWYHLDLLETTGRNAIVSNLGEKFLNGSLSNDEFIFDRIENYFLPNKAYKNAEVIKWEDSNLRIYPLKLIQNILINLVEKYNSEQHYISEDDLVNIVIPCSCDIDFNVEDITNHIIEFRKAPNKYSTWEKPQSHYTDDKGLRMANEFLYFLEVFGFLSSNKHNTVRSGDKRYMATDKFITIDKFENEANKKPVLKEQILFDCTDFSTDCSNAKLTYTNELITRYISSLITKPFVLLSGLSGSGKTKLAQSFAQWICEDENQYCIVPVGADWTNREPLLGYVNALDNTEYILPENGALKLLIEANKEKNQNKPYFLILDEMNLSHVERYFADFLSVMESKDKFKLHSSEDNLNMTNDDEDSKSTEVPNALGWSKNLFVVGTVNIDETTYMFSPKVLDRANAIEFRINKAEIKSFLDAPNEINLTQLAFKGANMAANFIEIAKNKEFDAVNTDSLNETLVEFFSELKKTGAEFGYRTGMEIHRLYKQLSVINETISENEKIDIAVMQKLLPKLHGSRRKLCPILETLAKLCVTSGDVKKDFLDNQEALTFKENTNVNYPLSLEKITRMYKGAINNGFASYAEA